MCLGISTVVVLMTVACNEMMPKSEHELGGLNAAEVFGDVRLAELARAACNGDAAAIDKAIGQGAEVDALGEEGMTPLFWSVSCQSNAGVIELLNRGADPNLKAGNGRMAPVVLAAYSDSIEVLDSLLARGADANSRDAESGNSALKFAVDRALEGRGWENFDALISRGADPIAPMANGYSIVEYLTINNQFSKAEYILKNYKVNDDILDSLRKFSESAVLNAEGARERDALLRLVDELG